MTEQRRFEMKFAYELKVGQTLNLHGDLVTITHLQDTKYTEDWKVTIIGGGRTMKVDFDEVFYIQKEI